mgnify:CR=1 FL=1
MSTRFLTVLPVFNEARHIDTVLTAVAKYAQDVLVVDDGSTDETGRLLNGRDDVVVVRHEKNRGYGSALRTAFSYAIDQRYELIVTIDCDGQHEPQRIPQFVSAAQDFDIVSGSRYMRAFSGDASPPQDRRKINRLITDELNEQLGLGLTDAFCGFKSYRVSALALLRLTEDGYAMPLELWVQAAHNELRIRELPVPRIYLEEKRSFGGALDDPHRRLRHYREVLRTCIDTAKVSIDKHRAKKPSCSRLCLVISGR